MKMQTEGMQFSLSVQTLSFESHDTKHISWLSMRKMEHLCLGISSPSTTNLQPSYMGVGWLYLLALSHCSIPSHNLHCFGEFSGHQSKPFNTSGTERHTNAIVPKSRFYELPAGRCQRKKKAVGEVHSSLSHPRCHGDNMTRWQHRQHKIITYMHRGIS